MDSRLTCHLRSDELPTAKSAKWSQRCGSDERRTFLEFAPFGSHKEFHLRRLTGFDRQDVLPARLALFCSHLTLRRTFASLLCNEMHMNAHA